MWCAAHPRPIPTLVAATVVIPRPLWALPVARPLGEDYIARLLGRPIDAVAASHVPSDGDLAAYDAVLGDTPDNPHDERLRAAREGRILALYRRGDYWRAGRPEAIRRVVLCRPGS